VAGAAGFRVAVLAAAVGCGRGGGSGDVASDTPLTVNELGRTWVALAAPRARNEASRIIRGPHGFVALAREMTGEGKVVGPTNNYLYRSDDGVTWHRLPLPEKPEFFGLRDLAYGAGRYVMVGNWGNGNELWTSTDLAQWMKQPFDLGWPLYLLERVNGRFFAFSVFRDFLLSDDGMVWTVIPSLTVQQTGVAFGNGRYVLVGSGPIRSSVDGKSWEDHPLDCGLPGACIQDPSGGIHQAFHGVVVFAAGRFYVDQLVSSDGATWLPLDGQVAFGEAGGYLFGGVPGQNLQAWRPGEASVTIAVQPPVEIPPLAGGAAAPETITAALPGGETCLDHRCLLLAGTLYLIR
jgi:hypothetical protein